MDVAFQRKCADMVTGHMPSFMIPTLQAAIVCFALLCSAMQRGQPFLACSHMQRLPSQQQQQQQQQPPAKKQACKVFISHARERKSIVASSLHTMLTQAAGISTYLDERGLIPGTPNATAMEFELHNAPVGECTAAKLATCCQQNAVTALLSSCVLRTQWRA